MPYSRLVVLEATIGSAGRVVYIVFNVSLQRKVEDGYIPALSPLWYVGPVSALSRFLMSIIGVTDLR